MVRSGLRPGGVLQSDGVKDCGGDVIAEVVLTPFQRFQAAADDVVATPFAGAAGSPVYGVEHVWVKQLARAPLLEKGDVFGLEGANKPLNVSHMVRILCWHRWSKVCCFPRGRVRECRDRLRPTPIVWVSIPPKQTLFSVRTRG